MTGTGDPVHGRVAVVTGASRGIGRAMTHELARRGARVGMVARDEVALKDAASRMDGEVFPFACDVTDPDGIAAAFEAFGARWDRVDSVIVNAGMVGRGARIQHLDVETWHQVHAVNLTGAFLTARAAHAGLARSTRGGRMVLVSSVMGRVPRRGVSAYAASKAGLEGLTRAVAADWARDGICVNAVSVGVITSGLGNEMAGAERLAREATERTPLRRFGTEAELCEAALFLAGDGCGFTTGHVLSVDGGYGLD